MTVSAPEVRPGNKFAITATSVDFLVTFGTNRVLYKQDGEGAGIVTDYHCTYSLSPSSAKNFCATLGFALAKYEKDHGIVPLDEKSMKQLGEKIMAGEMVTKPVAKKLARKAR